MEKIRLNKDVTRIEAGRRPIVIDFPPRQQGIAAALRRAFAATALPPSECEFERLLAKIH